MPLVCATTASWPAGTRSKGRASQRSPVACGSWSTARSRGTTSLCSSSAAPRTRANRSTPSRTSPIARSQAPGARSSPAHSVVRAVSDFRSGSGSATVNRGSTGKACPSKAFSRLDPPSTSAARVDIVVMPVATDCAWASRASTDAGPSSVIVRGTEPSTPRSAAAHNASVSCCGSGDASDTAASSLVVAAAYASATAAARVESSASSNRSPTSSWGRARSPAAAGRWVVTRVCAQWANARNAPSPTNRGSPGGGSSRRVTAAAAADAGRAARNAWRSRSSSSDGSSRPGAWLARTAESGDSPSSSNRSTRGVAWPATAAVNRIRRGSPRMRASQALSRGSAWDRGSRTGDGHEGGYASSPMRTSSRWV